MSFLSRVLKTNAPASVILVRLIAGVIFLSEGTQKFLFPEERGTGRFFKIGIPSPELLAPFVGSFEVVCGLLILLGLLTRIAAIPTIVIMLVALATTKLPILGAGGFWKMVHEARTDYAMLLSLLFLLIVGSGRWGLDARLARKWPSGNTVRDQS